MASSRMVSDSIPASSASATAARSTRSLLRGPALPPCAEPSGPTLLVNGRGPMSALDTLTGIYGSPAGSAGAHAAARRPGSGGPVSYTHLRAHETKANLVCRLL